MLRFKKNLTIRAFHCTVLQAGECQVTYSPYSGVSVLIPLLPVGKTQLMEHDTP